MVVFGQNLLSKVERNSHLPRLVIASQKKHGLGEADLEGHQQKQNFEAKVAPIHIVAKEDILVGFGVSADSEQLDEIVELSMDVSDDGHGIRDVDKIRLASEHGKTVIDQLDNVSAMQESIFSEVIQKDSPVDVHCLEDWYLGGLIPTAIRNSGACLEVVLLI